MIVESRDYVRRKIWIEFEISHEFKHYESTAVERACSHVLRQEGEDYAKAVFGRFDKYVETMNDLRIWKMKGIVNVYLNVDPRDRRLLESMIDTRQGETVRCI